MKRTICVLCIVSILTVISVADPYWDVTAGGIASDVTLKEEAPGQFKGSVILSMRSTYDPGSSLISYQSFIVPVPMGTDCKAADAIMHYAVAAPFDREMVRDNGVSGTANMWTSEITGLTPNQQYCFGFKQSYGYPWEAPDRPHSWYSWTKGTDEYATCGPEHTVCTLDEVADATTGSFTVPPVSGDVKLVIVGDSDVYHPETGINGLGIRYAASLALETQNAHSLLHEGDLFYHAGNDGKNITYEEFRTAHRHIRKLFRDTGTAISVVYDNHEFNAYWTDSRSYGNCPLYTEAYNAAYDTWKFNEPGRPRALYIDIPNVHKPGEACETFAVIPAPSLTRHLDYGAVDVFIIDRRRDGVAGLDNKAWITAKLIASANNPTKKVRVIMTQSRATYVSYIRTQIQTGVIPTISTSLIFLGGEFHDGFVANMEEGAILLQTPGFGVNTNEFHSPLQTSGLKYTTGPNAHDHGYNVILYDATLQELTVQIKKLDAAGGPAVLKHVERRRLATGQLRILSSTAIPWSLRPSDEMQGGILMSGKGNDTVVLPIGKYSLYADGRLHSSEINVYPTDSNSDHSVATINSHRRLIFHHNMTTESYMTHSDPGSTAILNAAEGVLEIKTSEFNRTMVIDPTLHTSMSIFAVELEVVAANNYNGGGEVGLVLCSDPLYESYYTIGFSAALSEAYIKETIAGVTTTHVTASFVAGLGIDNGYVIHRGAIPTITGYYENGTLSLAVNGEPVPGLSHTIESTDLCIVGGYMGAYGEANVHFKNTNTLHPKHQTVFFYALKMFSFL